MKTDTHAIARSHFSSEFCTADQPLSETATIRYRAIKEHLCCELNGEAVILSLKNGKYYGLNPVASRIWELIQKPLTLSEIENVILVEYDVEDAVCQQQVATFLEQMSAEKLIETVNETVTELF